MKLTDAPGKGPEEPWNMTRSVGSTGPSPAVERARRVLGPGAGMSPTTQRVPDEPSGRGQATNITNPVRLPEQMFRLELQELTLSHATFGTPPEHELHGSGRVTITRDVWIKEYERATAIFIRVSRSGGF